MIKNRKVYLGLLVVLFWIVINSILTDNLMMMILSILGIVLVIIQIRVNEDIKLVIVKNKIKRKYMNKDMHNYYVMFLEITNLSTFSQFYDMTLHDRLVHDVHHILQKLFAQRVYLYNTHQFVIVHEFQHTTVINQRLRNEEQQRMLAYVYRKLSSHKFTGERPDVFYHIKLKAGTGSMGIRGDYNTITDMIQLAYFTMLQAKQTTVNYLVATEETRLIKTDMDEFNQELEKGLEYDEIVPYFLPIIHPGTMKVIGCESLLRWEKNEYRIIEAAKFKQVAMEKNLFEQLDQTIITKSFQSYQKWLQDDLIDDDFKMTINVGMQTLNYLHASSLIKLAQTYGINPSNIEIDISEHEMSNLDTLDVIVKLKDAGFSVAMDAFQANNQILELLSRMPIDTLKLDRHLLPTTEDDIDRIKFYKLIIKLSQVLGYKIMAKGVENKIQLELAKELQVNYIQGYYITPPLNDMRIRGFLNKYHRSILE
ncbi:EAL domain-containing protein [Candidatus Xianfuyuplasma coldseepsis]|uniref:EAL domain-containing protein n=1 Tax=Candidatus Xianfuyuplasma coldseepsis TaxID=2782163 RepID=A0A7L7KPE3_9MOLU|nr:EAL domain-containing protein [Xianfuyuplasma coldseepsis]QMS84563.1 EAL domain-containing protein [Xianfuyuplasma coldseepsis]